MGGKSEYRVWAEIDLDALANNLRWIRHGVGDGCGVITVVKADAYGHGLQQIAGHLMQHGTDVLGVANLAEASAVCSAGQGWPILMLGACFGRDEFVRLVRDGVSATVSSAAEIDELGEVASAEGRTASVHLKIDTGMGRLGAAPENAIDLVRRVQDCSGLNLEGVYTHLSSSEDDAVYTGAQLDRFNRHINEIVGAGFQVPMIHVLNSGGLVCEERRLGNFVRPGLLVYGLVPSGRRRVTATWAARLRPVLSLKTRIAHVKSVPEGTAISYGQRVVCGRHRRLATVCAGYGDGIPRGASGRMHVLVQGQRCSVVGVVTMDQMVVDITDVPHAKRGDEVVVIGRQNEEQITVTELAKKAGTIPWEVLTAITHRVPRCYLGVVVS